MVTLAAGAAAGKFLRYEPAAPGVAAQTAYGIEAEVEGYGQAYDPNLMLFMDFRRHHTGVWDGTASRLTDGEEVASITGVIKQEAMHDIVAYGLYGEQQQLGWTVQGN